MDGLEEGIAAAVRVLSQVHSGTDHPRNRTPSRNEQGKVVEFVEALKGTKPVRYIDSEVVERTADKVFREHAALFKKLAQ